MDDELDPTIAARFSVLEQLEPPDAWSRIAGETDVVEFDRVPTPNDRHRSRPLLVAAAVLLVAAAGVVVVSRTGGDDPEVVPPESPSANSGAGPPSAATAQTASPSSIAETPDFGRAEIAPDVVRPGDEITITPARPVQNICTQLGAVYSIADQSIVAVVANDGHFTPGPDITIPACIGDTTDEALTYVVPNELDDGRYIFCVSDELTRDGCATFAIDRDAPDAPPAFGMASVEPEIGAPGDQLTITPVARVDSYCARLGKVYPIDGGDHIGYPHAGRGFPTQPGHPHMRDPVGRAGDVRSSRRARRRDVHRLCLGGEDRAGMRHVHGPTLAALQYGDLPGSHDYDLSGCRTRQVRGLPRPRRVRDAHSDLRVPIDSFTARIGTAGG